jgi:hypothetical protein
VQACLGTSTPTEGHSAFMQHPTGIGVARSTPPSFGLSKERVRQAFVRRWRIPSSCRQSSGCRKLLGQWSHTLPSKTEPVCRQSSGCRKLLGQWSHTLPSKTEPVQSGDALHVFLYTSILFHVSTIISQRYRQSTSGRSLIFRKHH